MNLSNTEPVRLYLYSLLVPAFALLVYYGVIESDAVPLWLAVLGALLAVGGVETARAKVTPVGKAGDHGPEGPGA